MVHHSKIKAYGGGGGRKSNYTFVGAPIDFWT